MLDPRPSQAFGLMDAGGGRAARMLAVVCHGDAQTELPTLWQICNALALRHYNVTVLDGTKNETEENPGLAQVLELRHWHQMRADSAAPTWQVLPARLGLQTLSSQRRNALYSELEWTNLAHADSLLVIYAPAEALAPLAASTGIRPLLTLSDAKTSLMTSYLAFKRLVVQGGVAPTVLQLLDPTSADSSLAQAIAKSLEDCVRHFLEVDIDLRRLSGELTDPKTLDSVVQKLLEESVTLGPSSCAPAKFGRARETQALASRIN